MKSEAHAAKRMALGVGLASALGIVVALILLRPESTARRGIGMALILEKQDAFRRDLITKGQHINDLEPWKIQEELARRSGLSQAGVKGLVQLARNARDTELKVEALLLAGDAETATVLALRRADALAKTDSSRAGRAFRLAADGYWRLAQFKEASECLKKAGTDAELDLAMLHWGQANFHPEDVRAELNAANEAVSSLVDRLDPKVAPVEYAVAKRLQGNVQVRMALLMKSATGESDRVRLADGERALRDAIRHVERAREPELWAAVRHDLGAVLLERSSEDAQPFNAREEAVALFQDALDVRTGKVGDGTMSAEALAQQLTERAETLAFQSLALARFAEEKTAADSGKTSFNQAILVAESALELSQPQDPGVTWFVAHFAKCKAMLNMKVASASSEKDKTALFDWESAFEKAEQNYPAQFENHPGIPSRRELMSLRTLIRPM